MKVFMNIQYFSQCWWEMSWRECSSVRGQLLSWSYQNYKRKSRSQVAYVFNPYDSSSYTFTMHQTNGVSTGNEFIGHKGVAVLKQTATHKGIQLIHVGSGNGIQSGATISVYGVK